MTMIRAAPQDRIQREELLRACRTDQRYDRQCEDSRAAYLFRLILATGDAQFYFDAFSNAFENTKDWEEDAAPAQMFEILCQASRDAAKVDPAKLRGYFAKADFDTWGYDALLALVDLEGVDALTFAAVHRYEALSKDISERNNWVIKSLLTKLSERDGAEAAVANLKIARDRNAELDALLTLNENTPPLVFNPKSDNPDFDTRRASIFANGGFPPPRWCENLSDADALRAANDLLQEKDERRILFYLQIFARRRYPLSPRPLLPLMRHSNERIPWHTARVLGQIRDAEIRALALEFLSGDETRTLGLRLLYDNFEPGDVERLETYLKASPPDPDTWEGLGRPILALFDRNALSPGEVRPLLLGLYENLPCSLCRCDAVGKLIATGGAPDGIVEECRFDADADTAALFPLGGAE